MERLCYSLLGVKWKMCWGIHWATSVGLRRPITERQRETVRKLSPYDVFPPSQRRFRRDTGGSQESYDSVGVMENRRKRVREQPTPREKEREKVYSERRRVWETLSLLCVSSVDDIMLTEGTSWEELNEHEEINYSFLNKCHCIPFWHISIMQYYCSWCWMHKNNGPLPEFINNQFLAIID